MFLKVIGNRLFLILLSLPLYLQEGFSQDYPEFGPERSVTIIGLDFDTMEPFISPDGTYLFFNNLNDGIDTKLFYAEYVNDSTFDLIGELPGTGQPAPPYLDAVADMDSLGNFYWTSARKYPADLDNLHHGKFNGTSVTDVGRVRGNFNMDTPGWLVMDHGISYDGQLLYYNNARFDNAECTGPCETFLGIAEKVNDSTFRKIPESNDILQNINNPDYIYYAPCITADNLELYYTRYLKGEVTIDTQIEICVAVRNDPDGAFSLPKVLFADNPVNIVEAPTLTRDQSLMYYHRKINGIHKIRKRQREVITGNNKLQYHAGAGMDISPNPVSDVTNISFNGLVLNAVSLRIVDLSGHVVVKFDDVQEEGVRVSCADLISGIYIVHLTVRGVDVACRKLMVR